MVFKNEDDNYRGIFSLYEFNTTGPITIRERRKLRLQAKKAPGEQFSDARNSLVEVLTFCFMPNHIHLLLKQIKDNGITQFMRKFGAGYAAYFNKKYKRKGHLFQGRFRAVHIKTDEQLQTVFVYIHSNAISLIEPKWKENGIKDPEEVINFLENYKWSSYLDYLGRKNFPSVTKRDFLLEIMGEEEGCEEFIKNWVNYKKEIKDFGEVELE